MVVVIRIVFVGEIETFVMPLIVAYGTILTQQNTLKEFVENTFGDYVSLSS